MTAEAPAKRRRRKADPEPETLESKDATDDQEAAIAASLGEPIEGEIADEPDGRTHELAVHTPQPAEFDAGTMALALLSDDEFSERLTVLKRGRERIQTIQRELLIKDEDYGLIPGTPKPTLYKAGAEKLCQFYRLAARLEVVFTSGDNDRTPPLEYSAGCFLHLGSLDGPVVATGHGTANSWEKRYIRAGAKKCPKCSAEAIIASKYEKGWYCFPKKGGCGAKLRIDDPEIVGQVADAKGDAVGAYDLGVTLMKMAEKRAFVDATLRATATSGLFTQDLVDDPRDDEDTVTDSSGTVVSPGGAVLDSDTGEVRGRQDDPASDQGPEGQASDDRDHVEHARSNELAAAANATDPKTGAIDADAIIPDPDPEPEVRPSSVPDVGRGGATTKANGAQVAQVKAYSKSMKLGPWKLADEIAAALGGGIDSTQLDDELRAAANQLESFLNGLAAGDIGKLISHLRKLSENA